MTLVFSSKIMSSMEDQICAVLLRFKKVSNPFLFVPFATRLIGVLFLPIGGQ